MLNDSRVVAQAAGRKITPVKHPPTFHEAPSLSREISPLQRVRSGFLDGAMVEVLPMATWFEGPPKLARTVELLKRAVQSSR